MKFSWRHTIESRENIHQSTRFFLHMCRKFASHYNYASAHRTSNIAPTQHTYSHSLLLYFPFYMKFIQPFVVVSLFVRLFFWMRSVLFFAHFFRNFCGDKRQWIHFPHNFLFHSISDTTFGVAHANSLNYDEYTTMAMMSMVGRLYHGVHPYWHFKSGTK